MSKIKEGDLCVDRSSGRKMRFEGVVLDTHRGELESAPYAIFELLIDGKSLDPKVGYMCTPEEVDLFFEKA